MLQFMDQKKKRGFINKIKNQNVILLTEFIGSGLMHLSELGEWLIAAHKLAVFYTHENNRCFQSLLLSAIGKTSTIGYLSFLHV